MVKAFLLSLFLLGTPSSHAWIQQRRSYSIFRLNSGALVPHAGKKDSGDGGAALETEDPCWQNFLDDDCQMSNIYSSSFIAADWIKSMPCGQGIEDCDMPEGLKSPETRPEAGVDQVDVVDFLGLKRAESLSAPHDKDAEDVSP